MARILVVDDEPDIATLVRLTLEGDDHEVTVCRDGESGIAALESSHHDAVVLDVTMPGLDGFEVLSRIKASQDPGVAHVPVVFLSARTSDIDRLRGGIEGALHYVTKPFEPAQLRAMLGEVLQPEEPEPSRRKAAQRAALAELARREAGAAPDGVGPRPRLTRLDRPPQPKAAAAPAAVDPAAVAALSDKQRGLLEALRGTPTVQEAAERLGVSRSNVYASLRRIARRLGVNSVPELVTMARTGGLPELSA